MILWKKSEEVRKLIDFLTCSDFFIKLMMTNFGIFLYFIFSRLSFMLSQVYPDDPLLMGSPEWIFFMQMRKTMGNQASIPHLQSETTGTTKERRAARINNHIRMMLWDWWYAAENARGVYVELKNGSHSLLKNSDYIEASTRTGVKKVLLFSNNGDDLNLFIEWVADTAPEKIVEKILAIKTPKEMIKYVWKSGLQKLKGKIWHLRTS